MNLIHDGIGVVNGAVNIRLVDRVEPSFAACFIHKVDLAHFIKKANQQNGILRCELLTVGEF